MHSLHVLLLAALLLVGCVREEFPDSGRWQKASLRK